MSSDGWSGASYLDALRPDLGWHVEYALMASYSADLVAMVAAMLALAGVDDDRGSGSKVDFANAIDRLSGKFRLVIQSGRLLGPRNAPKILGLLDQFVRMVPFDESTQSWHPKIALVKTKADDSKDVQWRLWVGSRNLTRDMSWDVGLTLVGKKGGDGRQIDGVIELAQSLAIRGDLSMVSAESIASELRDVVWQCPTGCNVSELRLHDGGQLRTWPEQPNGLKRLLVISPFLDGSTVKTLSGWGTSETKRTLVSSKVELLKLADQKGKPLDGFHDLLMMTAPDPDELIAIVDTTATVNDSEDEEPEPRGLHAKIIVAEHGAGTTMWVGSANATIRGWRGPNAELIARMSVSPEVMAGVWSFVYGSATTVKANELVDPPESDEVQERLDAARSQVAAKWQVTQAIDGSAPVLTAVVDPNPKDADIHFAVASLCGPWMDWQRENKQLRLPLILPSEVTELIACRLTLEGQESVWLQRAPLDPHPGIERDRQALARYLDPKTFLQWLRSLLVGTAPGDCGGSWNSPGTRHAGAGPRGPDWWSPTLEEILRAWSRDPSSLLEVDRKAQYYLDLYRKRDSSEITDDERKAVTDFENVWSIVRSEMVAKR